MGSLRADLREQMEPGPTLDALLNHLHVVHPDDRREMDDFRDRGRRKLFSVMYAAAMAHSINENADRFDEEDDEHVATAAKGGFREVDGKRLAAAQFLGRELGIDPDVVKEEAQRMAEEMAGMGAAELSKVFLQLGGHLGLPASELERLANDHFGLRVVSGGAAAETA